MLRKDDCITAVPMLPGEVPMIPVGLRANEFFPQRREPQSIAFLRAIENGTVVFVRHEEDQFQRRGAPHLRHGEGPLIPPLSWSGLLGIALQTNVS
jgi:hypothetical protein